MADESIDDRLTPRAIIASKQEAFDPRHAVRVGQLDAVVDADVELFHLNMEGRDSAEERKTALIASLITLRPRMVRGVRESPEELRQSAGRRPRARIKITCPIFEGGHAMVEMVRIDGPVDDVDGRTERLLLEERVKRLLAARILEELSEL